MVLYLRLGQEIREEVNQTARKAPEGNLSFTWRLQLSSEPFEGRAEWSPREPGVLSILAAHGPAVRKEVPADARRPATWLPAPWCPSRTGPSTG